VDLQETPFSVTTFSEKINYMVCYFLLLLEKKIIYKYLKTTCSEKYLNTSRKKEGGNLGYYILRNSVVHTVLLG
jgi:hypothetical protein